MGGDLPPSPSVKGMKILPGLAYFAIFLCAMVSCGQTKESKTGSEIISPDETGKASFRYDIVFSSTTRPFPPSSIVFELNREEICVKITELLSRRGFLSYAGTEASSETEQKEGPLGNAVYDYHFAINIGWNEITPAEKYADELRMSWVEGSFGLFPATMSDKIEMDLSVTSRGSQSKTYHYENFVTYVYWGPNVLAKRAATNQFKGPLSICPYCTQKIEEMMNKFLKNFSKEWLPVTR